MNLDNLSLEELDELEASIRKRQAPKVSQNMNLDNLTLDELDALEASIKNKDSERGRFGIQKDHPGSIGDTLSNMFNKGAHLGKLQNQAVGRAATNLPNIPQGTYNLGAMGANLLGANLKGFSEDEMPGHYIQKGLKHVGVDLNAEKAQNDGERLFESLIEGGAGAAMGGGLGAASKGIPYLGKAAGALLGSPETAGQVGALAGAGAAISGALKTLQDAGIDTSPLMLGVAALPAARATYAGMKGIAKIPGKINNLRPSVVGHNDALRGLESIMGRENIPSAIESINQSNANQSSFGYKPTTAEVVKNPGLSMLQETYRGMTKHPEVSQGISERTNQNIGAVKNRIEELQPKGPSGPAATQEYFENFAKMPEDHEFYKTTSAPEAGTAIRKGLKEELSSRKSKRRADVGDEWSEIDKIKDRLNPKNTHAYLDEELRKLANNSDARQPLEYMKGLLEGDKATIGGHQIPSLHPEVYKLSSASKNINKKMKLAKRAGDDELVRIYSGAKEALNNDLKSHPQVESARKNYAQAKKPENEIALHGTFKKILKTSDYDATDLLPDSSVPREIVSSAAKSESIASDFMKLLGDKKEVMEPVKGYINNKIINDIVDKNGNPSLAKIHKFKEKYPGAFTIYKNLDIKLKNSSNATKFLNDLGEKNYRETTKIYDATFKSVVGSKPEKMVQNLLQSGNPDKKIAMYTKILDTDKTGQAWEGARRATMDYISEKAASPAGFVKFYQGNVNSLKKIVGPEEMHFLTELNKRYSDVSDVVKQSITTNSATGARLANQKAVNNVVDKSLGRTILDDAVTSTNAIISGHLSKVPGGKILGAISSGAYKWYQNAVSSSMQKTVQRALLEPSYAKMLLEDITTKHGKEAAKKFMGEWRNQYLSGYSIGQHASDMGKDDNDYRD